MTVATQPRGAGGSIRRGRRGYRRDWSSSSGERGPILTWKATASPPAHSVELAASHRCQSTSAYRRFRSGGRENLIRARVTFPVL